MIFFQRENPTQLEDSRMWGTWFLADLDTTHLNFGACISGAYEGAPFAMKLDRPIDKLKKLGKAKRRKKRQAEGETVDVDATGVTEVGEEAITLTPAINAEESKDIQKMLGTAITDPKGVKSISGSESIQAYWKYYRSTGGIKEKLMGDVECFKTLEKRNLVVKELKDAVCTSNPASQFDDQVVTDNTTEEINTKSTTEDVNTIVTEKYTTVTKTF